MKDRKPDEDTDKLKTENQQLRMEIADVSIRIILKQQVIMIRKCHNHKSQGTTRKNPQNNPETQERQSKQINSSLFPIVMIPKLEWTQSNAQQNLEQLQKPTMRVTINNESTTTYYRLIHRDSALFYK